MEWTRGEKALAAVEAVIAAGGLLLGALGYLIEDGTDDVNNASVAACTLSGLGALMMLKSDIQAHN